MGLLNWLGFEADEPWRKLVRQRVVEAVDEDTGEIIEIVPRDDGADDAEGLLIEFDYLDANGRASHRTVFCYRSFRNRGYLYLHGYCCDRDAMRSFRTDRMEMVRFVRSRRSINPATFFDAFAEEDAEAFNHLREVRREERQEAEASYRARLQREKAARAATLDGLRVLAYLGLADGDRSDAERASEEAYVRARLSYLKLDCDVDVLAQIDAMSGGLAPTRRSFVTAVGRLAQDDAHLSLVWQHALALARADGISHEGENEALRLLLDVVKKKKSSQV